MIIEPHNSSFGIQLLSTMKNIKLLAVLTLVVCFNISLQAQTKYYDYRLHGDIYNGLPVQIKRQCKYFDIDEVIDFNNGKQVIKSSTPFKESDQKYDSKGRLIYRKFSPTSSTEYEWFDANFVKKIIIRNGSNVTYITPHWYANYLKSEDYNSGKRNYIYREFDSYGNWIKREENQSNIKFETTRQITYTTPKSDNYLTVTDKDGVLPGAIVEICEDNGKPVSFIKPFVTDINGRVKNLPWRINTKYRISFAGYNTVIVDGNNPNQKVYMSK